MHSPNLSGADDRPVRTDPLAPHRERIMYPILMAGVICFVPFMINSLFQGNYFSGLSTLLVVICYAVDVIAIRRRKRLPIPFAFLLFPMVLAMIGSSSVSGIYGALWAYPAVLACFFVLSRRSANLCSALLLAGGTAMVYFLVGPSVGIRFCASLALTIAVVNCILSVVSDLQCELMNQAITDPLTGAYNRRHMADCLSEVHELNRRSSLPATLLLLDIDHFKQINDRFGHEEGDSVLKAVVALIRERIRKTDKLFRMGGEEFLLLLPGSAAEHGMTVAESLRQAIEKAELLAGCRITVSIGVSQYASSRTPDDWIRKADEALYRAKAGGRNATVQAHDGASPAMSMLNAC